jgi:hypothetical protein
MIVGSGVRRANSRRILPNRFKDYARRLGRLIPMREVAAALEPVQMGRRERYLGACRLARQQQVILAAPAYGDKAGGRRRTLLQRPACQLKQHRIEHRCSRQALQLPYDKLRWQCRRTGRQLGEQQRTGDGVARQAGMEGPQQSHQAYRCRERPVKPARFPSVPETAGIKRHAVPTDAPPRKLQHQPAPYRTADKVRRRQALRLHESGEGVRMGLYRLTARERGRSAMSRQVDQDQFPRAAQCGQERIPGAEIGPQPMDHE